MNATGQAVDTEAKAAPNNSEDSLDYESLAAETGWTPKEKFRGDPEKWKEAKDWYERTEHILPLVKKQRDESKEEAKKLARELAEVKSTIGEFQKFTEAAAERKVAEMKAEIALLKDQRAEAVASGDKEAFRQADAAIDARTEALAEAKTAKKEEKRESEADPDFADWLDKNRWYVDDPKKKKLADEYGIYYSNTEGLRGKALYEAVAEKVKSFEADGTERPGPQRGGKANGGNSKAKSFDNLLPEYKQGFEKMVRNGIKMTKEQYVSKCDSDAWGA